MMGIAVGQIWQNKLRPFQFCKVIELGDGVTVLTPRRPEDPAEIKNKIELTFAYNDFKRAWKVVGGAR